MTSEQDAPKELLESILKAFVSQPGEVKVTRTDDEMGVLLRVWVNKEDMGLVIGKGGVTASAIKLILKMVGYQTKSHIAVKIEEPDQ